MLNCGLIAKRVAAAGIQFIGAADSRVQTTSTIGVTLPAGAQAGDLILVAVSCGTLVDANVQITGPFGYTERGDYYQQSSDGFHGANLGVYTKVHDGTDTTVHAQGLSPDAHTFVAVAVFRGVHQSTPLDVAVVTSPHTDTGGLLVPSITPVTPGALIVGGGISTSFYESGTGSVSSSLSAPTGWTLAIGSQAGSTSNRVGNLGVAYKPWSGSGASGNSGNFGSVYGNGSSRCGMRFALALRPA
ncbi:MAG: hypothetical protein ACOY5V_07000 [Pseudomonadota bacterium]